MLQEVHCIEKTNHLWKAEWGYQANTSPRMKATKQVCAFSSTIILTFRSKDFIPTLWGDLLSVT